MRILLIGGTRFSGPHIVRSLIREGHELMLFHRGRTQDAWPGGVRHLMGDRDRLESSAEDLRSLAPDLVVDMVATTEQQARTVMQIFAGVARRVIAISSQDVYRAYGRIIGTEPGPAEPVPLRETAPLREKLHPYRDRSKPGDPEYDYEKILVERAFLGCPQLPGTIIRYPMVYGPEDAKHRLFPYLKRMDDRRPAIILARGMAAWRWTRGYVENVAHAVVLAVTDERARGKVYNVGEPTTPAEAEWVRTIGAAAGWSGRVVAVPPDRLPEHLAPAINTDQHLVADTGKIREELGYSEPVTREEALLRTVAWERAHPPLEVDASLFDYAAEDAVLADLGESVR